MDLRALAFATMISAAVTAVMVARRRAEHVPAAVALVLLTAATLARVPLYAALGPPPVEPYHGAALVLVYLDGAAELASYASVVGLAVALAASPERRRRAVAIVGGIWLVASVVLAALYPSPLVRGAGLHRVYLTADLVSMFAATVALVTWARAGIAAKRSPRLVHVVAIGLVLLDLAILVTPLSPWRGAVFGESFDGVQVEIVVVFSAITAAQVILWRFSTR